MSDLTFLQRVTNVQSTLNAPKNQLNKFGGYMYRNLEDILEAVKPLLKTNDIVLTLNDEIIQIGDKAYLRATGRLTDALDESKHIDTTSYVELSEHKGMSSEQAVGTASSYARKYALGGLLLVDDNKDPDTNEFTEMMGKATTKAAAKTQTKRATTKAVAPVANKAPTPAVKPAATNEPTKEQKKKLIQLCEEEALDLTSYLETFGVQGKMTMTQYNKICSAIMADISPEQLPTTE